MKRHKCIKRALRGFTLIELLVVISIIAVLMGILLPSLGAARETARALTCMSDMRQLGVMITVFTVDYKDKLPANRIITVPGTEHVTWRHWLVRLGYASTEDAWVCPSEAPLGAFSEEGMVMHGRQCTGDVVANYAYNGSSFWSEASTSPGTAKGIGQIVRPSHTILLLESQEPFPDLGIWMHTRRLGDDGYHGSFGYWHKGQGNWLRADGSGFRMGFRDTMLDDCMWHNGQERIVIESTNDGGSTEVVDTTLPTVHEHPEWIANIAPAYAGTWN
ncbi:type II secretion system protein [Mucisphaera calidilacus]|uniref:Type II secretion system protein G n=1 Tax=Mucisphaera calidilacus TaxID=2527982 RepID=A0A518BYZ3_9BACT|nr:prepilin-type N-terminal cleavage/methylation domain-containing protein [Mucisphaera calidilacus]QDU72197.1 hypothetical protein Pan265_20600 [Mucisphaera calidilacus]